MIFPNYNYKEFNNTNKKDWMLQPPTFDNWCLMLQGAQEYCKTCDVDEWKGKCKDSDLPSFHPHWKQVAASGVTQPKKGARRGLKDTEPTESFPDINRMSIDTDAGIITNCLVLAFGNLHTSDNVLYRNINGRVVGKRSVYTYDWEVCWLSDTTRDNVKSWWCGGKDADYEEEFEIEEVA